MKKAEKEIVMEQGKDGTIIYRFADFNKEIDTSKLSDDLLGRFHLIMEKFKVFLDCLGDGDENVRTGVALSPIINEAQRELVSIANFISKTIGDIHILYDEDVRYRNFYDRNVAGIALIPASKKIKEAAV